ncbi:hypothetical protein Goklo_029392 [Gossypium klotzschianum]|uniref:Aspartic peptidase DDI1-type domain-containing protein n=1 Tax=Gossypium klotzschianum TaxID=34286 RepID=A0A7J8W536_9ROSI|nr:hypothetical protein [Gossypium klotzschianum]
MIVVESLIKFVPRKDKFKSSKPKGKSSDGEDKDGQVEFSDDNGGHSDDDKPEKASIRLGSIVRGIETKKGNKNEKKPMKCFLCCGLQKIQDYPKRSKLSAITKEVEAELVKDKVLDLGSMMLKYAKAKRDHKHKGFIYVNINIINQKKSVLIDTEASDLFISKKARGKLGLPVSESTKKIKIVNSKEVSTVAVAPRVELQIDQ